jgi:protein CpxP
MNKLIVSALFGSMVFAPLAMAAPGNGGKAGCMQGRGEFPQMQMMQELDLSDAQQAQVRDIMQQYRGKGAMKQQGQPKQQGQRGQAMYQQRMAIISSAKFDEAAAQALIAEQAERHQSMMVNHLHAQQQVYQILTPEQQQKYQQLHADRMEKHQRFMAKGQKKAQL